MFLSPKRFLFPEPGRADLRVGWILVVALFFGATLAAEPAVAKRPNPRTPDDAEAVELLTEMGAKLTKTKVKRSTKRVTVVDLSECDDASGALVALAGLPHLQKLNLRGTNVTDDDMEQLAEFKTLRYLDVEETDVTLKGLRKLEKIDGLNTSRHIGTTMLWARSAPEAAELAKEQEKLVFLLHVSGNFEVSRFT